MQTPKKFSSFSAQVSWISDKKGIKIKDREYAEEMLHQISKEKSSKTIVNTYCLRGFFYDKLLKANLTQQSEQPYFQKHSAF